VEKIYQSRTTENAFPTLWNTYLGGDDERSVHPSLVNGAPPPLQRLACVSGCNVPPPIHQNTHHTKTIFAMAAKSIETGRNHIKPTEIH
jgi:hypothetical protein